MTCFIRWLGSTLPLLACSIAATSWPNYTQPGFNAGISFSWQL